MIRITTQPIGMIGANACLIESDDKNVLIDPGGSTEQWEQSLPNIDYIICTHGHFDHIAGADQFREITGAPLMIHAADAPALTDPELNASIYFGRPRRMQPADRLLADGDQIQLDRSHWLEVISTPGHTPGGICLLLKEEGQPTDLFSGDTLFAGSIGRLDIGGNAVSMQASLDRLMLLPDTVRVYPGHGPMTTIGEERATNPYILGGV